MVEAVKVKVIEDPLRLAPAWTAGEMIGMEFKAIPLRTGYAVEKRVFLDALTAKSPDTAGWFREHMQKGMHLLTFGPNEVVVLPPSP